MSAEPERIEAARAAAELHALTAPRDPPDPADVAHDRARLAALDADAAVTRAAIARELPPLTEAGVAVDAELRRLEAERAGAGRPDDRPPATVQPSRTLAALLDDTAAFLRRYVAFFFVEQADACALWVGHSWTYDAFETTPYLAVQSAEKQSGKTRLLEALDLVVREPLPIGGTSLAALFRIVNEKHPTVLHDEADVIFRNRKGDAAAEDLRGLFNSGYRRGRPYLRTVGEGKKMRVEKFDVFCPKALASIGTLPDTVQDRSIVINLRRRSRREPVEPFRARRAETEAAPIREAWEAIVEQLALPESAAVPAELSDRGMDSWEPLCAVADAAGGSWPARARRAAVRISGPGEPDEDTLGVLLLADVRAVFDAEGADRLAMRTLLERLLAETFAEHPWQEWGHGRGLKATGVGRLLSPFGIRVKSLRLDGAVAKGYERGQFEDVWERYLPNRPPPPGGPSNRYTVTPERDSEHECNGVTVQGPPGGEEQAGDDLDRGAVDDPPMGPSNRYTVTLVPTIPAPDDDGRLTGDPPWPVEAPAVPPPPEQTATSWDWDAPTCGECGRRMRAVPSRPGRFVCTGLHGHPLGGVPDA